MAISSSVGGAAAAGGTNFEARAAGWYAVHMLAEAGAPALPGHPADVQVRYVRCQTGQSLDDILVGFSDGAHDFVQAKRSLTLDVGEGSELSKSLDQCVRQFVGSQTATGERPWDRLLDSARDRLLLAVGPTSSKPIREDLRALVDRVRQLHRSQPLSDAAVNNPEQRALAVVSDHIRRSWKAATRNDPSDDEVRMILSLLVVVELDLDPNGTAERLALLLLRAAVMHDPTQDSVAWAHILGKTAQLAQTQSGIDRSGFETSLRDAGIRMRGVRSYEQDVSRLKAVSAQTLALVERFASFKTGGAILKLPRLVHETVSTLAVTNSFAIVGEPGAGKSASLFEAASALAATSTAVVVLQAVDLASRGLAELRLQLGLEHTVLDVLANWREANTGVLFIDALDAARDEESAGTVRDLIALVHRNVPRFTVVASIRSFDLKQGTYFQNAFRGSLPSVPPEYQRSDFAQTRHVVVPRLSDKELRDLADLAPLLRPLMESASGDLKELLRIPFNVQLLAQLVDDGAELSALRPLRTQGELLDLYWNHRVRRDAHADARETLLRRVCKLMVSGRQLRVDRTALALGSSESALLFDLLSGNVLVELESPHARVLTFSHHLLFDYAAARLLLPVEPDDLAAYLVSDPALLFVLRPSLVLAFHERWRRSRVDFWATTLRLIADDRIEAVGEVIGPVTAVDLAVEDEDWSPLFEALEEAESAIQSAAAKAIQYVVGSLVAENNRAIVGADAGPWAGFAERIAASLRPDLTGALRVLLHQLTQNFDGATPEQQACTGRAARLLLQFVERAFPKNRSLMVASITFVARTIAADPEASTQLLRACLDPDRVRDVGYEELPALAREADRLMADPAFLADLYIASFTFKDESRDATSLGGSAILSLTSNRAQDYEGAHYALAEVFPAFFKAAPVHATVALVRAVDAYAEQQHAPASGAVREEIFAVGETTVCLRTDYSEIWDKASHDDAQRLLAAFEKGLVELSDTGGIQVVREVLDVILKTNRMAALWRRLLRAGAQRPDGIGILLLPLLQRPLLLAYDTSRAAMRLMRAVYPHLASQEREELEEVLLSLPGSHDGARPARERIRDECLRGLPRELIVKDELRDLVGPIEVTNTPTGAGTQLAVPDDEDDEDDLATSTSWLDPDEEILSVEEVDLREPLNAHISTLIEPVEAFATRYRNTEPAQGDVDRIFPEIAGLEDAAHATETKGVHAGLLERARLAVAEAYSVIPKSRALSPRHPALQRARQGLLHAAQSVSPEVDHEIEAGWNTSGSGWSPADRIEAAQGLLYLARRQETCDPEVVDALERLAADPVAAVRYQIATNVNLLYHTAQDRMWRILESRIREEPRGGVAHALLESLNKLVRVDEERVATLTIQLAKRFDVHEEVTRFSVEVLAAMWIWRGTARAYAHLEVIIANLGTSPKPAGAILHVIRTPLPYDGADDEHAAIVRHRAFELTKQLVQKALEIYRTDIVGHDFSRDAEADIEHVRSIIGIIAGAARELRFASGAQDASEEETPSIDAPKQRRFYTEAKEVIELLIATGLPSATHSLVEMFESMIPLEPEEVFFRIRDLIRAGHTAGYSQESLAIDLIVRIVERYLADYRHLFQTNADLREALSEILNVFIQAGWPQALGLATRLEDIFR